MKDFIISVLRVAPAVSADAQNRRDQADDVTAVQGTWLWAGLLALATVGGSLATACMMPFVAVAVMAARTLSRRRAIITVVCAWAGNQAIGFGLLGYPLDRHAVGWGIALGVAALLALAIVRGLRVGDDATLARLAFAAILAFAGYEVALFGYALVAGGLETFTPAIIARLAANEAVWCFALVAGHRILVRVSPAMVMVMPPLGIA